VTAEALAALSAANATYRGKYADGRYGYFSAQVAPDRPSALARRPRQ